MSDTVLANSALSWRGGGDAGTPSQATGRMSLRRTGRASVLFQEGACVNKQRYSFDVAMRCRCGADVVPHRHRCDVVVIPTALAGVGGYDSRHKQGLRPISPGPPLQWSVPGPLCAQLPRTPLQWLGLSGRLGLELGPDSGRCWTQLFGNF